MKHLHTEISINATPEKIWNELTDFKKYPEWNPLVRSFSGNLKEGEKVTVKIEPPGSNGMTLKPTITRVIPNKEFRWQGHLLFPGLFDGEHIFQIEPHLNGTSLFKHSENFKGILIPLFRKMLDNETRKGFEMMNEKLKEICEKN